MTSFLYTLTTVVPLNPRPARIETGATAGHRKPRATPHAGLSLNPILLEEFVEQLEITEGTEI